MSPLISILNFHDLSHHMSFFLTVYIVSVFACQYMSWLGLTSDIKQPKRPYIAASRFMGIAHSIYCVPICTRLLFSSYPHWDYSAPNTAGQIALMHITLSYFLVDLIHFLLFEMTDILLLVHHSISISFYLSVMAVGHGGLSFLVAYFVGEITNPLQSTWFLTKEARCLNAYGLLSPIFTACFLVVRVILTPPWVYAIIRDYFYGQWASEIPIICAFLWSTMSIAMVLGSYVWAYKLVLGLRKFYAKRKSAVQPPSPTSTNHEKQLIDEDCDETEQADIILKKGL